MLSRRLSAVIAAVLLSGIILLVVSLLTHNWYVITVRGEPTTTTAIGLFKFCVSGAACDEISFSSIEQLVSSKCVRPASGIKLMWQTLPLAFSCAGGCLALVGLCCTAPVIVLGRCSRGTSAATIFIVLASMLQLLAVALYVKTVSYWTFCGSNYCKLLADTLTVCTTQYDWSFYLAFSTACLFGIAAAASCVVCCNCFVKSDEKPAIASHGSRRGLGEPVSPPATLHGDWDLNRATGVFSSKQHNLTWDGYRLKYFDAGGHEWYPRQAESQESSDVFSPIYPAPPPVVFHEPIRAPHVDSRTAVRALTPPPQNGGSDLLTPQHGSGDVAEGTLGKKPTESHHGARKKCPTTNEPITDERDNRSEEDVEESEESEGLDDWEVESGCEYLWSESRLMYHDAEGSGHYYHPASGQWYDPETDEWYTP